MKILNLTDSLKKEIKAHRARLANALDVLLKSGKELPRLERQRAELEGEIVGLQLEADPSDVAAVRALTDKRTQLELLNRRIVQVPVSAGQEEGQAMRIALIESERLLTRTLVATQEDYISGIAGLVRPYFTNDAQATYFARQTGAASSLAGIVHRHYGQHGNFVGDAREALQRCDEILSGELNWSFDSKQ